MSEETIFDQTVSNERQQSKKVENTTVRDSKKTNVSNQKPEKKDSGIKRTIGSASLAGAAGVVVGLLTPVQLFPQSSEIEDGDIDAENETAPDISSGNSHYVGHEMEVATTVDDSMSFSQAFAAARNEVGAGGLFTWHGHTYGTYYAEEWNAMSPADKEQYWADVNHTTSHLNEELQAENEAEINDVEASDVDVVADNFENAEQLDDNDNIAEIDSISDDTVVLEENPDEILGDLVDENSEILHADEEIISTSDESSDLFDDGNELYNMDENPDLDLQASNSVSPDIAIDNDMDMSDFA